MKTPRIPMNIHGDIVSKVPELQFCWVQCTKCGKTINVDAERCLQSGWPECHGCTMSLVPHKKKMKMLNESRKLIREGV